MKFDENYLDMYGLPLPSPTKDNGKPADNCLLFLSIAIILDFNFPNYEQMVRDCYLDIGLLARWKGNDFDQAQFDDYLGVAVACCKLGNKRIPREILLYGITHFFVYNTDHKLEFKDFLLRNFAVWPSMFMAAFPSLKWLMYPFMWAVQKTFTSPSDLLLQNDTSGLQLQWAILESYFYMGFHFESYTEHLKYLPQAFKIYYSEGHPFNHILE